MNMGIHMGRGDQTAVGINDFAANRRFRRNVGLDFRKLTVNDQNVLQVRAVSRSLAFFINKLLISVLLFIFY